MLRVAVALLLAAAALAAVDLRGLVDVVSNESTPLERFTPTYVFEVNGCRVLVYVADPALKNSPMTARQTSDAVRLSADKALRPLTSAEAERLLNALFQSIGPSATATVVVRTKSWELDRGLRAEARNVTQLAEEVRRALGTDFYLGAADAYEALNRGAEQAAYLHQVYWEGRDLIVFFIQGPSVARIVVMTDNLSAAVEALKKAKEAAGELWNSVNVELTHGPYLISDNVISALTKAAMRLERELGIRDEEGRVRGTRGFILISGAWVGPLYVIIPYPNGTAPDSATAERIVRRFVELSNYCKSPLVVEFWPKTEPEPMLPVGLPPLWPYAIVAEAALAVAVVLLVLARRRR